MPERSARPWLVGLALALVGASSAFALDVVPRVGVDFEHFDETYRITDDADTVATIDELATYAGVTLRSAMRSDRHLRVDADVRVGQQTGRFRLDVDGRWHVGENAWEVEHDGSYRFFSDDGDYAVIGDYLQDYLRLTWERRTSERLRFRIRDSFDVLWYRNPDEYNLSSTLHRPAADVRIGLGDLSEMRVGYRFGLRDVPDSTSLGYRRHTIETDLSLLFGWTSALDVAEQVERRIYSESSVRESSWEHRLDLTYEFSTGQSTTFRVVHENEVIRYDDPDALDFDSAWARTGFQVEVHRTRDVDLSVMPVYAFLSSATAPEEEYTEAGLEFGVDWRLGDHTWINLSDEVGRRDYEIGAAEVSDSTLEDALDSDLDLLDTTWSDYLYNRLTLLLTSSLTPTVSVNLFANWQPESHGVSRDDTETRLVSGGVEYRF